MSIARTSGTSVRPPAVAGLFYPSDPRELSALVASLLSGAAERQAVEQADAPGADGRPPRAVIVPHAGYVYSGPVAASAYAGLAALRGAIDRVILVGPSHRVGFHGVAFPSHDAFATPLGVLRVDRSVVERCGDLPCFHVRDDAHAEEHCLETQLPFLEAVLGDVAIVPLVYGRIEPRELRRVLERAGLDGRTLLVVSSDLSHYLDYDTAASLDAVTTRAIERLDGGDIGAEQACGRTGVQALLEIARARGYAARTLDLRNSGDTAGPADRRADRVVGYGAYAFA